MVTWFKSSLFKLDKMNGFGYPHLSISLTMASSITIVAYCCFDHLDSAPTASTPSS